MIAHIYYAKLKCRWEQDEDYMCVTILKIVAYKYINIIYMYTYICKYTTML